MDTATNASAPRALGLDGARVLVADDEPAVRYMLRAVLEEEGLSVVEADNGVAALHAIEQDASIALVLSDLRMPGLSGLELLAALQGKAHAPPLILITAHGSERVAVEAMKLGAVDYFRKPIDADEIAIVVRRHLGLVKLRTENQRLRAKLSLGRAMVFESAAMQRVAEMVERVAARDVTVLIVGETGTGKELVARALVAGSPRKTKSFVRFNCASVTRELVEAELFGHARGAFTGAVRERKGLFREAHQGTLFLDEVNSLDPTAQASLLRVIQEREVRPVGEERSVPVDVRLIAASGRPLDEEPGFRKDLYYRLNVVTIRLPPLRERREDIPALVRHFVDRYATAFGLGHVEVPDGLMAKLVEAPWPGNVRELEHAIESMLALSVDGHLAEDGDLGFEAPEPASGARLNADAEGMGGEVPLKTRMNAYERGIIASMLSTCGGNRSEAARRLGIDRVTLISKMKRHELE
ncbi:MAG: sigma-54-dependent Fis family transcriptional regulator [Deltaproteobacteria bacterium]|nr:sigma-54-dependent Fis family transcriptional regulator [Deltaproteobacteria bacterium]